MAILPEQMTHSLRCEHCAIRHKSVCGALSSDELEKLNSMAMTRKYKAGETILSDTDDSTFFGNIISGVVKLTKMLPDGRQQVVGLQFPSDFIGRAFGQANPYFADAATSVEICCFQKTPFEKLLKEHSGLEHRLFENVLNELDSAREWMLLLGRKTAAEKLASFLAMLLRRMPELGCAHIDAPDHKIIELPLSRADIADYLGLTIETISRQFTNLKNDGIIRNIDNRHCEILDPDRLADLAGQDYDALD
jgi:CRP/FNR family transcriptional regulator